MTDTIRFPRPVATPIGAAEANQIIEIRPATGTFEIGGPEAYVDVSPWRLVGIADAAPYCDIVVEFTAEAAAIVGDGTNRIGLFGEIDPGGDLSLRQRYLIGVLGMNLGNDAPQIPIIERAGGEIVGYAQVVCNIAVYDRLSIGGIEADVTVPGDVEVTVTARPIRKRDYSG